MGFQDKVEAWMNTQERNLKKEEGRWKRYPRTILMMFGLAIAFALLFAMVNQVFFPPPPPEPTLGTTQMTIMEFVDTMLTVQLPGFWWAVIFLFLWMTKWT